MPDTHLAGAVPSAAAAPEPVAPARGGRPSRDARPLARLLVDAVQGVSGQEYPWEQFDVDDVVRCSLQHGVTPALAVMVRERDDAPRALVDKLQGCYRDQLARHIRTLADLRRLAALLSGSGLRWAVVKGPALAEGLWPRPDLRLYVDLDILIDRHRLGDALTLLESSRTALVDRNWPLINQRMQGELSMALPFGTPLDLHWHLVNDPGMRRVFRLSTEEVLDRCVPTRLGSVEAPVMDPVDTVMHLAYHMAHSGGHRLVWLRDFDLAISAPGLDLEELLRRAESRGCGLALAVSLRRTRQVLERDGDARPVLPGGAWGRIAALADRWRPVPKLPSERRSARIVFQSTRATTAASLAAAAGAAVRLRGADQEGAGRSNPLHLDVDDPVARDRYIGLVQAAVQP